jgi:hypothetical protein
MFHENGPRIFKEVVESAASHEPHGGVLWRASAHLKSACPLNINPCV